MQKRRFFFSILLIFLLFAAGFYGLQESQASERQKANLFHVYGAFGPLYGLGSARIGVKGFEAGLLTSGFAGAAALLNLGSIGYTAIGLGVGNQGVGLYGGLGAEFWSFWLFDLRIEMAATTVYGNYTEGEILLGLNASF